MSRQVDASTAYLAIASAFILGAASVYLYHTNKVMDIAENVGKSVKEQQISNANDACFEYMNAEITADIIAKRKAGLLNDE